MKKHKNDNDPGRRRFLFSLGACSALAITGFFIGDFPLNPGDTTAPSAKPALAGVKRSVENDCLLLSGEKTVCAVNKTGEQVINLLDGKKTLPDICRLLANQFGIPHSDELEVAVATFICRLGMAGFLVEPFYVTVYEA
ncbi:MAG: PqqD family protein [Dysgonamonadaceae bacterium]|jgi:hypothetical protein|nr:PqqD family protein [Dysgonamonadaceae bacterium]